MNIPTEYLIPSLGSGLMINGQKCVHHSDLMRLFDCPDINEFEKKFIEPTRNALSQRGEIYENHIIEISIKIPVSKIYYFSALAIYCMTMIAISMQINPDDVWEVHGAYGYSKYRDTSFFVDPDSERRGLRVGDKVEILTPMPDVLHPNTAMISYAKKKGAIVAKTETGNFHVVISSMIPAAEFKPSSLKRII